MSSKLSKPAQKLRDSIAEDNGNFELTEAQKRELDRRIESFRANPSQGRTWEEIKSDYWPRISTDELGSDPS
jgi:putative addiction module component (TIGR02574 family)